MYNALKTDVDVRSEVCKTRRVPFTGGEAVGRPCGAVLGRRVNVRARAGVRRVVGHPVQVPVHPGVHAGTVGLGASLAPRYHAWKFERRSHRVSYAQLTPKPQGGSTVMEQSVSRSHIRISQSLSCDRREAKTHDARYVARGESQERSIPKVKHFNSRNVFGWKKKLKKRSLNQSRGPE